MPSDSRRRRRRLVRGLLWGVTALHVLEAIKLRARRDQVRALPGVASTGTTSGANADVAVSTLAGNHVDAATRAAVAAEMEASGVDVVDLLPGDMPTQRALAFLRRIDLDRLAEDPFYTPGGAAEAVALRASVAERMGLDGSAESLPDRGALLRRTVDAQRYAPAASAVRVAPDLRATPLGADDRWHELSQLTGWTRPYLSTTGLFHGLELAWLALLTAGPWLAPLPGLAALATWSAQPALVFADDAGRRPGRPGGGSPPADDAEAASGQAALTPPDVLSASLWRLPRAWADGLSTAVAGVRAAWAHASEQAARPIPPAERDEDVAKLFEPRRDTCPWCDSRALEQEIEVPDLLQQKPGTYRLDRCRDCDHVFQNPQLTPAGLDRIYADIYHGAGGETADVLQTAEKENYWGRANAMARFTEPSRWLDVGCSYGHFFLAARRVFPKTTFDGLDMGDAADEGVRRGWIDHLHKGFFPEQADSLPSYDVVSMHHYLEHTKDPRVELAAMMKVLEPGGYLMIELPDPETPWSQRLGRYWWQWGQPQHLHFMTCDNLVAELERMGFEVLQVERGGPSFGSDLSVGLLFWAQSVSRSTLAPWLPPPTVADRVKRAAVFLALVPALVAAHVVDRVDVARVKRTDAVSNVFRLVARRTDH